MILSRLQIKTRESHKQRHYPSCCVSGTVAGGMVQTFSLRLSSHGSQLHTQHSHMHYRVSHAAELWAKI